MLDLTQKAEIYSLGLYIGYFTLSDVVGWADKMISELDISSIPNELYDISMPLNKKIDDVVNLLHTVSSENHIDLATKVLLGLFYKDLNMSQKDSDEIITSMYRLVWKRNVHDDLFYRANGLESEYETAVNGYGGEVQGVIKDIIEFLRDYQQYGELF
ncbi:hypothetical protein [Aneurinibacillus tyrosinisolvens]|uniref:hypothetical protein n=1 Tax=Aneurinibacillus tyrosinisolvens TaxID=1443435 RepID=UPI00063F6B47|nr:hypothetical protein [Aneurinibacillus tyrosinisolvens]